MAETDLVTPTPDLGLCCAQWWPSTIWHYDISRRSADYAQLALKFYGYQWFPVTVCWSENILWNGATYLLWNIRDIITLSCFTHWGWVKIDAISQITSSNAFSWMKMYEFWLRFPRSLFPRFQLMIFQHWFRKWLGTDQVTSHYLNHWWLVYWRMYASLGLNELRELWGHHNLCNHIEVPFFLEYPIIGYWCLKLGLNQGQVLQCLQRNFCSMGIK